jgi:hypothetical protein
MFDYRTLVIDDEDTTTLDVVKADGTPTGASIVLRSLDSPKAIALVDKFTNKRLSRMQKRQGQVAPITSGELRVETIDTLAACVVSWSGFGTGETALECTDDNVVEMLTKSVAIRDQVDEAVKDRTRFTKA